MSAADTHPLPLLRVLPWWPALLASALLAAAPAGASALGWLDAVRPDWLRGWLVTLADPKMAVAAGAGLALVLAAWTDLLVLRAWRRGIASFRPDDPGAADSWTYLAYLESLRSLPPRHDGGDIRRAIERRGDKLRRRLAQGWLFKYYLFCFALPLAGGILGLFNLEALGGALSFAELFAPLLIALLGSLAALVLALAGARRGKQTLELWEEKAFQIVGGDAGRAAEVVPLLCFRQPQVELTADEYVLRTELALSDPSARDVEAILAARHNSPAKLQMPAGGRVSIPAGRTAVTVELTVLFDAAVGDPGVVELELTEARSARVGSPARQVVRWRSATPASKNGTPEARSGDSWPTFSPEDEY